MSVTVEQVKHWHVFAGVGHVVSARLGTGWLELACGTVCTGDATGERPKRVCRKCRERLKDAVPVADGEGQP